jgi:uncharacterized protein YndB with AHSA1/START domain
MTIANQPFVKAEILVRKKPPDVFNAFADASAMSKFWFTRRDDGLEEGKTVSWFVGSSQDASAFDVFVKELNPPHKLVIEWESGGGITQVSWTFKETMDGDTILTIEEFGFKGSSEAMIEWALDSTGGFNQVIVAAKAHIEHGVEINVVSDHVWTIDDR